MPRVHRNGFKRFRATLRPELSGTIWNYLKPFRNYFEYRRCSLGTVSNGSQWCPRILKNGFKRFGEQWMIIHGTVRNGSTRDRERFQTVPCKFKTGTETVWNGSKSKRSIKPGTVWNGSKYVNAWSWERFETVPRLMGCWSRFLGSSKRVHALLEEVFWMFRRYSYSWS